MSTKEDVVGQVINRMVKAGDSVCPKITVEQKEMLKKKYETDIIWAMSNLPTCSSSVYAVVVKCLIKYNKNTVVNFCKSLKNHTFNGKNDPVFLLWKYLKRNRGQNTIAVYRTTVCAAKAYMEGRTMKELVEAKKDIFSWDENFNTPFPEKDPLGKKAFEEFLNGDLLFN